MRGFTRSKLIREPACGGLDALERLRGHQDRAAFKQTFLQILLARCAAASTDAGLIRGDAAGPHDSAPVELSAQSAIGDDLASRLASCADALLTNEGRRSPPIIFDTVLRWFARAEGRSGAESTTPEAVAQLLIDLAAPARGTVLDPCCGCAGLLVRAQQYAREKNPGAALALYGQELDRGVRELARMNLAANGIRADLGAGAADSLAQDLFPALKADTILANPPFNLSGPGGAPGGDDEQGALGFPPSSNRNFAWIQHFIAHMAPSGTAVFTSPLGSLAGTQYGEGKIRERIVRADWVDCIIALPRGLFDSSRVPVCVWVLTKDKTGETIHARNRRPHSGETLFIDAQNLAKAPGRRGEAPESASISRIVSTYHAWKTLKPRTRYADTPGFCRSVRTEEIAAQGFVLSPSRYVEPPQLETEHVSLDERIQRFKLQLAEQLNTSARLDAEISERLQRFAHDS